MEYDLENMTLLELIDAYGSECMTGADSQGYLSPWPDRLRAEIENRIERAKKNGVNL